MLKANDSFVKFLLAKVWPKHFGKVQLGVGQLPKQEIA
jgi:hypothetical protein